jgi:hypothetical protein
MAHLIDVNKLDAEHCSERQRGSRLVKTPYLLDLSSMYTVHHQYVVSARTHTETSVHPSFPFGLLQNTTSSFEVQDQN